MGLSLQSSFFANTWTTEDGVPRMSLQPTDATERLMKDLCCCFAACV